MTETWPDNICNGRIRYSPAKNYDGFSLEDTQHGIPTFGSVCPPTVRGQYVNVFNYPTQTEEIARRLVACWNACCGIATAELESYAATRE